MVLKKNSLNRGLKRLSEEMIDLNTYLFQNMRKSEQISIIIFSNDFRHGRHCKRNIENMDSTPLEPTKTTEPKTKIERGGSVISLYCLPLTYIVMFMSREDN